MQRARIKKVSAAVGVPAAALAFFIHILFKGLKSCVKVHKFLPAYMRKNKQKYMYIEKNRLPAAFCI